MTRPLIRLKNLTFTYAGSKKPALKKVNLEITKGEFIILTGPSGCGKTTLCRILVGLIPHFYPGELIGKAIIFGRDVRRRSIKEIAKRVNIVFQNPDSQIVMTTVEREVAFGLENLRLSRDEIIRRVNEALSRLDITDLRSENIAHLSGGQKQRVAIASILAMMPDIMILDEPTAYLSPSSADKLFELLNKLNSKLNMTIILVEHRLDLAVKYASKLIIMVNGRITLQGPPKEVLSEDLTKISGVNVPSIVKLYHRLKSIGVRLREVPLTPFEAAILMREVLK